MKLQFRFVTLFCFYFSHLSHLLPLFLILVYHTFASMSSKTTTNIENFANKKAAHASAQAALSPYYVSSIRMPVHHLLHRFFKTPARAESLLILFTFGKILFAKIPLIKDICFVFPVTIAPLNNHEFPLHKASLLSRFYA